MKIARTPIITKRWLILILVLAVLPFVATAKDTASLDEQLIKAAENADYQRVKRLLDKGADPNAKDYEGGTVSDGCG